VFADGRVRSWASILDGPTRKQVAQTAELSVLAGPIALMADAHLGKGATIGTVLVTENAILPMAVGVDIGCGMAARQTRYTVSDLDDRTPGSWVGTCRDLIPAGLGHWHAKDADGWGEFADRWGVPNRLGHPDRAGKQLGTLGSGNHFVELAVGEGGSVWILLHSGSRGAGNQLAQVHAEIASTLHPADGTTGAPPNVDLAWLDVGTPEFEDYVADLRWAQAYAMENRRRLLGRAHEALDRVIGALPTPALDEVNCHHNYAEREFVEDLGRFLYVTRKGAIRAGVDDRGLIPGAMGQASFVVRGLGNPLSYSSSSHGAGRVMSRGQAYRTLSAPDFVEVMSGVAWQNQEAEALLDEHPAAYKDVETVMADQADLVAIEHRLKAIANYKGVEERRGKRRR
jgi:tRNA-splicing ligase RtcB